MVSKNLSPKSPFFIANFSDFSLKDDMASMESPFFSLSKKPDLSIRYYEHNGNTITVTPSAIGIPTIYDKDILIYCCSQLISAMNKQKEVSQIIHFNAHDLLISTNRSTGKIGYNLLQQSLTRLRGCTITTNIKTGGKITREGFGLIEYWKIVTRSSKDDRMSKIEIKLSDWLYRSIVNLEILTLHSDYFKLSSPIEKRLYEICKKHCGYQSNFSISLPLLHKKIGSNSTIPKFRYQLKKLMKGEKIHPLLDYNLRFDSNSDKLFVYSISKRGSLKAIADIL